MTDETTDTEVTQEAGDVTQGAAPATFKGVEYKATPLSDKDLVELDKWIQAQYIARSRESLKQEDLGPGDEDYDNEMSVVRREALTITWMSAEGAGMMATIEGTSRVLWHQLRRNHRELTHEDVRALLTGQDEEANLGIAQTLFRELDLNPTVRQTEAMEKLAKRKEDERKKLKAAKRLRKQKKKAKKLSQNR